MRARTKNTASQRPQRELQTSNRGRKFAPEDVSLIKVLPLLGVLFQPRGDDLLPWTTPRQLASITVWAETLQTASTATAQTQIIYQAVSQSSQA